MSGDIHGMRYPVVSYASLLMLFISFVTLVREHIFYLDFVQQIMI